MTATAELRRLLDERGVEWGVYDTYRLLVTSWNDASGHSWVFMEHRDGSFSKLTAYHITPAQAITATLGSDDTFTREDVESAFVSGYSLGLDMFNNSKPDNEKGWNQNERDMEEEMEDLGWVRKDAATLGAGTCHDVGDPSDFCCSECGVRMFTESNDTYTMIAADERTIIKHPNFCPNCGGKVVTS